VIRAIHTSSIDQWLERLSTEALVFVPQRRAGGDVALGPLGQGARIADYGRLAESPKRILLPQMDDLVRFEDHQGQPALDRTERILFGLRPCDTAAVAVLDEFFGRDYPDPNYQTRRSHMRLIAVACLRSEDTCFCLATETGPIAVDGFDVQLFDLGEIHLAEVQTDAGEAMVARGGELFNDPGPDAQRQLAEFRRRSEATQTLHLDLRRVRRIIAEHGEPPDFWQKVSDQCLMCGGCAYVCPTCTCYNIVDRPVAVGRGVRQRLWDTCVLSGFTREAGGRNPRQLHSSRCAHRYLHKLGGSDIPGRSYRCVGCGRCAQACIARMGIIRVVNDLLKQTSGE
jgi:sulfhydrogenase subunit beta (sulfur reductase)